MLNDLLLSSTAAFLNHWVDKCATCSRDEILLEPGGMVIFYQYYMYFNAVVLKGY